MTAMPVLPSAAPGTRPWVRYALLVGSVAALLYLGMAFRWWHWGFARPLYFWYDMRQTLGYGRAGVRLGFLNVYDTYVRDHPDGKFGLDYSPLRLLVFTVWGRWVNAAHPEVRSWSSEYAVNRPLLLFNTAMEVAAAVVAALLVYHCRVRAGRRFPLTLAVVAAAVLWLNPQMLISSWGRPAWEVWVLPVYLFAVYLASEDRWLASGAVVGVGIMLKGQIGVVMPVFVLWPLFGGRVRAAAAWVAGFASAAAVVVAPWMLTRLTDPDAPLLIRAVDRSAVAWVAGGLLAAAAVLVARRWVPEKRRWATGAGAVVVAGVFALVAGHRGGLEAAKWTSFAAVAAVALLRYARWPDQPAVVAALAAALLIACVPLFHGTMSWYRIGFKYGAEKFPELDTGDSTTLAAILQEKYRLKPADAAWTFAPHALGPWPTVPFVLTVEQTLWGLYALSLLSAAWGMHRMRARPDVRWLAAVATPWLAYFAFAPRMHERYLLWGAAVASVTAGVDLGLLLLGVGVASVISWANTTHLLLRFVRDPNALTLPGLPHFGSWVFAATAGTIPDLGWAVVVIALVFVYQSLRPPARPRLPVE